MAEIVLHVLPALALVSTLTLALVPAGACGDSKDVRDFSTENEWNSTQLNALGGVGHMSEELVDQFFADPSLPKGRKSRFDLQIASVHVMYSKDLRQTTSDARTLRSESSGDDTQGAAKTVDLLDKVRSLFGRKLSGGANVSLIALRGGGFTFVPYVSGFVDGGADVPSWPRVAAVADAYAGFGVGYGLAIGKVWDVGLNVRPGYRTYAIAAADVSAVGDFAGSSSSSASGSSGDSDSSVSELASYGMGVYVPVDLGTGLNLGKTTRVNLVARNVGGAPALKTTKGETPPVYPMRLSLGVNGSLWESGQHRLRGGTDVQDLLGVAQKNGIWYRWQWAGQYLYRLSSRKETTLGLDVGLRSGLPAVGVFLDLILLKLEGAWFQRETGYYPGQRPQSAWSFRTWTQMTF